MRYSEEQKQAVIRRMMPPESARLSVLSTEHGISEPTLYNWRKEARAIGQLVPGTKQSPEQWSSVNKFRAVVETAAMNAQELSAYCRERGLYVEQLQSWRKACEDANTQADTRQREQDKLSKVERKRIKELERELARKEKALAEAAALLVLRKKLEAFYGTSVDD